MSEQTATEPHPDTPRTVGKDAAYRTARETPELLRADAGDITSASVSLEKSGAEHITADHVVLDRSGARTIDAKSAQLSNSGAVILKAENVVLHGSSAVGLSAREARLVNSNVLVLKSDVTHVEGRLRSLIHIGSGGEGGAPVFSARGAVGFGAGLGAVALLGGRLLRRLFGPS
ncbi:MAG: hypothetical protein ACR2OO_11085 [Thermomicrobiales bacterium]